MGKNYKKSPKWQFSPICDPQNLFKILALSFLYPYGALNSCKISENFRVLSEIFKDIKTEKGDYYNGPHRVNSASKKSLLQNFIEI